MKPKDLKSPFSWAERRSHCEGGVLYVPIYYSEHDGSCMPELSGPVHLEFCSGNGDWIVEKALERPEVTWIACEMLFDRVRKIWSKRENRGVKNLLIVCGMAQDFVDHYLPEKSIDAAYVNFPDPWFKKRQAKHRLIQEPFIGNLARRMKPGGTLTLVTDYPAYASQMHDEMAQSAPWGEGTFAMNPPAYGYSYFEALWKSKGYDVCKQTFGVV